MNREEAIKIIEQINQNEELIEKLTDVASVEDAAELINAAGIAVTVEDINQTIEAFASEEMELSEDQLDCVAGGYATGGGNTGWLKRMMENK